MIIFHKLKLYKASRFVRTSCKIFPITTKIFINYLHNEKLCNINFLLLITMFINYISRHETCFENGLEQKEFH